VAQIDGAFGRREHLDRNIGSYGGGDIVEIDPAQSFVEKDRKAGAADLFFRYPAVNLGAGLPLGFPRR
jgi:hypothetical protein